jgi:Cu-processing system ATP-binding protein
MIQVERLTRRFVGLVAVNEVSFTVNDGECFALLGPNGSGKTTTLKCMVGLLAPTAGKIRINGCDVRENPQQAKAQVSYLPQRIAFPDNLTAREVLNFYARLRKLAPARVDEILSGERFHFNGFADKAVSEFSGGMIQRLGLAVACLPDAPILLLDEPTVSLDPEGALRFRAFLQTLKQAGKTIVFTSHVLADVEQLADRVAILVGGQLVALESVAALRESLLRGSRMRVELALADASFCAVARQAGASEALLQGDALLITSRPENRLEILQALERSGGAVTRFATEEPTLEDVYLHYIREHESHAPFTA